MMQNLRQTVTFASGSILPFDGSYNLHRSVPRLLVAAGVSE
jgi:hypothetical protein